MNGQFSPSRMAGIFVEVADTLVDEFDLIDFLNTLTSHASEVSDTAAVGLLLADQSGRLEVMAASRESARLLELFVLQNDEGPCRECHATGEIVVVDDLERTERRWPAFTRRALDSGFRSVCAIPMRHSRHTIGVLNLFNTEKASFGSETVRVVQALADVATIGLLQERAVRSSELLTEQLQGALNTRIVIEQVKGILAQQRGIGVEDAFTLLRGYCRQNGLSLTRVARAIVSEPRSHPQITQR